MIKQWWHLEINDTAKALSSHLSHGLSAQEAALRLIKYGPNQLKEKKAVSPFGIFLQQFKDFIIWVLIGAALISGLMRELIDAAAIIAIVILNAIMGFIQEFRAEKSLAALKKMSSSTSKVIRNGQLTIIPSNELVPGDLVELEAGDKVPADSRITWATSNFSVQEASLTGESTPVVKTALALEERDIPLADRANMVYMGTSVVTGKAKALVTETAMQTALGNIAGMIQDIKEEETPLQKKLEEFGKKIIVICFILVGFVFMLELIRGGKLLEVLLTSVSLAVAAIPEGLPAVVTITLALGVQRMVKRHSIIRKLSSVETLGCATIICSDKTGTLTKNEMTVRSIFTNGTMFTITGVGYAPTGDFLLNGKVVNPKNHSELNKSLICGVMCNSAQLSEQSGKYTIIGDPTEGSILTCAAKTGIWKETLEQEFPFVEEIPFDSERKKMTIIRKAKGQLIAFVKGAPDILLNDCVHIEEKGTKRKLEDADRKRILTENSNLADQAMRVLAVAYKPVENPSDDRFYADLIEKDLIFVGLIAMIDPPREEAKKAIKRCDTAGIRSIMITGDHKNTAVAIAKELGLCKAGSIALTGEELDNLGDNEFDKVIGNISVYARVSPQNKLQIVRAWRKRGEIVAMTGDGINDAPSVKEADIGVAMGITGTDVTKETSDMVITDDNFASIVSAIEEGRGIYDNIKKFIHYLLSCNTGEILVMFLASLFGLPVPLLPIHILWVNLVTDGLPALALGVDPVDKNIMQKPPRDPAESIVTKQRGFLMIAQGAFIAFCSLFAFCFILYIRKEDIEHARTAAFIVLACSQLFHSFNCRSMTESLFKTGIFTNSKLILANTVSFLLQVAVITIPFSQRIFSTTAIDKYDWGLVLIFSSLPLWAMELVKLINKKFGFIKNT